LSNKRAVFHFIRVHHISLISFSFYCYATPHLVFITSLSSNDWWKKPSQLYLYHSLSEGGTPAKFLIIDDGWQDTVNEFQKDGEPFIEGSQWASTLNLFSSENQMLTYWFLWNCRFGGRLISIKENSKFRAVGDVTESGAPVSLKDFVSEIKSSFGLKSGSCTWFFLVYMCIIKFYTATYL